MTTEIDLRDRPADEHRADLFAAIDEAEAGDDLAVVAPDDVDPHLVRYQLDRERTLHWEYDDPDAEPRELRVTVGDSLESDALGTMDVRDLKPQRRHEGLLTIFEELGAGEGFVLVNDHDPKPLYHELRSLHGDIIDWEYASRGDDEWRIELVKTEESEASDDDVLTRYDVREIPKPERHPTIHHRYGMIPEGGTMEIVAPHEPRPLRQEFQEQYGDTFTWEVVESERGRCRVHITKTERTEEGGAAAASDENVTASHSHDDELEVVEELDVREFPPAQRHELIFEAYDELDSGTGFVLVNDHDPKPLYHQFEAEEGPAFRWNYRQREPGEFRVLIGKAETAGDSGADAETDPPF